MIIRLFPFEFSVCKTRDFTGVDLDDEFCFIGKTDKERSVVCRTEKLPNDVIAREDGWRMFGVVGQMDFSLVGILSKLTTILAEEKIPVFALSTYDTDYILVKKENAENAKTALMRAGHDVVE